MMTMIKTCNVNNNNNNNDADADADNHGVIVVPSNIINTENNINDDDDDDDREASNNKAIETGGCLATSSKNSDNGDTNNGDASSGTSGWGDGDQSTTNRSTDTGYSPSNNSSSNKGGAGGKGFLSEDDPALNIAEKENRAVSLSRIGMIFVLVLTTICVSLLVYTFVDNAEKYSFELSFNDDTIKLQESLGSSMDKKLAAVDSLAMLMVSSADEKNETFPFTTLTDFAVKAAKVRHVMFSSSIAMNGMAWYGMIRIRIRIDSFLCATLIVTRAIE